MLAGNELSTFVGVAMLDSGMFVYLDSISLKSSPLMVSSTISLSTILSIASLFSLHPETHRFQSDASTCLSTSLFVTHTELGSLLPTFILCRTAHMV